MMCYRDMTFCNEYKDCKDGATCRRALTPKVIVAAGSMPISQFASKPECFVEKEDFR